MKKQGMLAGVLCAALLASPGAALAESEQVYFRINETGHGGSPEMGYVYISDSGRTMMPLGMVSEMMECTVQEKDGDIHIFNETDGVDVELTVGSRKVRFNGKRVTFETAPLEREGHIYLPVRDFGELFGSVYWDGETRIAWLYHGTEPLYKVIGNQLLRADEDGIHKVALPQGFDLEGVAAMSVGIEPVTQVVCNDEIYLRINCEGVFDQPIPLFRVEKDGDLTYLCEVPGSGSFAVDGKRLYTTANMNAGGWNSADNDPTMLYATTLGETPTTTAYRMNFEIVRCQLSIEGNDLIATNGEERHVIALNALEAFEARQ